MFRPYSISILRRVARSLAYRDQLLIISKDPRMSLANILECKKYVAWIDAQIKPVIEAGPFPSRPYEDELGEPLPYSFGGRGPSAG